MSRNKQVIMSNGEMRSNICIAELRAKAMEEKGITQKASNEGNKDIKVRGLDKDLNTKIVTGATPLQLKDLRKKATKKVLIKDEVKTNTEFINEMIRLGNIYTEVNDIELDIYQLNEQGEIVVITGDLKCNRDTDTIKNVPVFLVEEEIYTEGYNSLVANKISGNIEKIVVNTLAKCIYKHTINTAESFVTMIRKIPKILRKNLTVVGNSVDIAILKLILSKSGYNQDNILGVKYFVIEELDKTYVVNLGFLKVNYCLMSIDSCKEFMMDVYNIKVGQYSGGEIACKDALIELDIQAGV